MDGREEVITIYATVLAGLRFQSLCYRTVSVHFSGQLSATGADEPFGDPVHTQVMSDQVSTPRAAHERQLRW